MARLNLTLDDETLAALERDAKKARTRVATLATRILREAVERKARAARWRAWEDAYRAGAGEDRRLLREIEGAQLELMGDEED